MYRLLSVFAIITASLVCTTLNAETIATPSLINPRLRLDPVPARPGMLRFLTTDDNPPFNFLAPDGALAGFNVDLARAICQRMKTACTIQARRADLFAAGLSSNSGDALIPAPQDPETAVSQSLPYLPRAARFAIRSAAPALSEASAATLQGRTVGVVSDSPYAAFLTRYIPGARQQTFVSHAAMLDAFATGSVDLVFTDAADLAFWLNGVTAAGCCAFVPGAFLDVKLFGAGLTIATRAKDDDLRRAIDSAIAQLDADGTITELYLRYFPVPIF